VTPSEFLKRFTLGLEQRLSLRVGCGRLGEVFVDDFDNLAPVSTSCERRELKLDELVVCVDVFPLPQLTHRRLKCVATTTTTTAVTVTTVTFNVTTTAVGRKCEGFAAECVDEGVSKRHVFLAGLDGSGVVLIWLASKRSSETISVDEGCDGICVCHDGRTSVAVLDATVRLIGVVQFARRELQVVWVSAQCVCVRVGGVGNKDEKMCVCVCVCVCVYVCLLGTGSGYLTHSAATTANTSLNDSFPTSPRTCEILSFFTAVSSVSAAESSGVSGRGAAFASGAFLGGGATVYLQNKSNKQTNTNKKETHSCQTLHLKTLVACEEKIFEHQLFEAMMVVVMVW
jgi:hypothetical protein